MLLFKTYVAPSDIDGIGLFAGEVIPKGKAWWRFDPVVDREIRAAHLKLMPSGFKNHIERYGFLHDGFWTLCGDLAIFVNHSGSPNSNHHENASIAARDIEPGEEITENYGDFHALARSLQESKPQ
jgi:uncharacterized protein